MNLPRRASCPAILTAAALLVASPGAAQRAPWVAGAAAAAGLFVGNSSDFLDGGWGLDLSLSRAIAGPLRVRADGMLTLMAEQSDPFETADNRIWIVGVGPELGGGVGPLGVQVHLLFGRAAAVQVRTGSPLDERTTWASAVGGGAAVRVRLGSSVGLEAGGDIVGIGELDFARTSSSSLALREDPTLLRLHAGLLLYLP